MQNFKRYILFAIILIGLGYVNELFYKQATYNKKDVLRFEKTLQKLESRVRSEQQHILNESNIEQLFYQYQNGNKPVNYILYQQDTLKWWTDISFQLTNTNWQDISADTIVRLNNSWQYVIPAREGDKIVIGFVLLKYQFPYENKFLSNTYTSPFNLPREATIEPEQSAGNFAIANASGKTIGYVELADINKRNELKKWLGILCYVLALLSLLYGLYNICDHYEGRRRNLTILSVMAFLVLFKITIQRIKIPFLIYSSDLFSPSLFADSFRLPSLGDFLMLSIVLFVGLVLLYKYFKFNLPGYTRVAFFIYGVILSVIIYFFYYSLYTVINNSNISFEAYKVQGLNTFSFVGWFIILLQGIGMVLLLHKLIAHLFTSNDKRFLLIVCVLLLLLTFTLIKINLEISWGNILLFLIFLVALYYVSYRGLNLFDLPIASVVVLLLTLIVVEDLNRNQIIKERRTKQLITNNLAYEHDPVAESLLGDIDDQLANDSLLQEQVFDFSYSMEDIYDYLKKTYFSGYWNQYDLQITLCSPEDSIALDNWVHCYTYFNNVISGKGVRLSSQSAFYFLDIINGRINYIGEFCYNDDGTAQCMYIELMSKLTTAEVGYPELLLRGGQSKESILESYSYAKYYKGKLLSQSGDYPYSLTLTKHNTDHRYRYYKRDGYRHLQYRVDNENVIIVSSKAPNVLDHLISFSYVFIFFYLMLLLSFLVSRQLSVKKYFHFTLQSKVQLTIISILLISLLLIGTGSVYFAIQQYREKHYDMLQEKINSVYIELDHKLAMEESLDETWYSDKYGTLDQLLQKFSDVFYTDINLYYPNGELMASSRKEVFEAGLTGKIIDPKAYKQLVLNQQAIFIHREHIGDLRFLSAYVPFMNAENELLAYLNLPYFTQEDSLRTEITNLIVALLNIYVILILLTIGAAVLVSRQITLPLATVQRKMKELDLKEQNEPIYYEAQDEVGQLVTEYNRMVAELERSADLLAKSERESAWREMAKQIAHEIKNPLTPMKLSIQHLQRSWKLHEENFDEYIKNFTDSLIEQIENLSAIATAFSNFAKMPVARKEEVNLVNKIHNMVHLFENDSSVTFNVELEMQKALILADKEQITRALNNIVKNGIQSIPKDRDGKIHIHLMEDTGFYVLTIADNGKGIPEELRDQLFLPNFTTKSSGMGLGLAITKSIIESNGGAIEYTSEVGVGTRFIVRLPVKNDERDFS
ncbi:MAG: hypothetical protein GVY19_08360 [Bacteroidetes bacterium]|jgi:signal transduction histidine kinase|nr:hypothetical protein [Bacteroidota bacterium]